MKGIDGIISRPTNEVNSSTSNGKSMETSEQPEKKLDENTENSEFLEI